MGPLPAEEICLFSVPEGSVHTPPPSILNTEDKPPKAPAAVSADRGYITGRFRTEAEFRCFERPVKGASPSLSLPPDSREIGDLKNLICPCSMPKVSLLNPTVGHKSKGPSVIPFSRTSWHNGSCVTRKNS